MKRWCNLSFNKFNFYLQIGLLRFHCQYSIQFTRWDWISFISWKTVYFYFSVLLFTILLGAINSLLFLVCSIWKTYWIQSQKEYKNITKSSVWCWNNQRSILPMLFYSFFVRFQLHFQQFSLNYFTISIMCATICMSCASLQPRFTAFFVGCVIRFVVINTMCFLC